jgi:WD40 repeat protein
MKQRSPIVWLAASPTARRWAAGGAEDGHVGLWSITRSGGRRLRVAPGKRAVYGATFSPDGKSLWVASDLARPTGALRRIELRSGEARTTCQDTAQVQGVAGVAAHAGWVAASLGRALRSWDARTGEVLQTLSGFDWQIHAVRRLGAHVLTYCPGERSRFELWDVVAGTLVGGLDRHGPRSITCVTASPDGLQVAAGHDDGSIALWRLPERTPRVVTAGRDRVQSLTFTTDGRLLAGDGASRVQVWQLDGQPPALIDDLRADHLAWAGDRALAADEDEGTLAFVR